MAVGRDARDFAGFLRFCGGVELEPVFGGYDWERRQAKSGGGCFLSLVAVCRLRDETCFFEVLGLFYRLGVKMRGFWRGSWRFGGLLEFCGSSCYLKDSARTKGYIISEIRYEKSRCSRFLRFSRGLLAER